MTLDNNKKTIQTVILAGGKGTRMKSSLPKPLVAILGRPILAYILDTIVEFSAQVNLDSNIGVVVGYKKELLEGYLESREEEFQVAWQKEQKGTAHALQCFFKDQPQAWKSDYLAIVCGDTPLLDTADLVSMFKTLENQECDGICASFVADNPHGLGRIIHADKGFKIVEHKDASGEELSITEVNSGLYLLKTSFVKKYLTEIDSQNKSSEFYLTDLFATDRNVVAKTFEKPENFLGINDLTQLSYAENILQTKKIKKLQQEGVRFINPVSNYIEWTVDIAEGCVVYPNVCMEGNTAIGLKCKVESGVVLKNTTIESETEVYANSYLEDSHIGSNCKIGPFARIRPGSSFEDSVKVGNFVETKNTLLKEGAKVSHLSYVGDAEIGEQANIGCGFITCNYDGANKHKTTVGSGSFIGSDCQMIAPIVIGKNSFIAAGSTITNDVPDGAFAIARGKQTTKNDMAKKFLKKK